MMKTSRLLIEHHCPQCGAPATLEETERLFTCPFCRVKSYLVTRDYFRYMLPHAAPVGKSLVFLPYWRFKGSFFASLPGGIKPRIVDVSQQAVSSPLFPVSLGLRSQTLKLRFVSPESEGVFLKPKVSSKDLLHVAEEAFTSSTREPMFAKAFIGETMSQIYSPFYVTDKVIDAVLNRPVSSALPEDFDMSKMEGGKPDWRIEFIPSLCPNCGWDLQGEKNALALSCKNCNSLWMNNGKKFARLEFGLFPAETPDSIYFPFYRIRADVSGINLSSYADLVKTANMAKVVQEGWEEKPFRFWTPAFKIRPQDFLFFSRNLTLSQPPKDYVPQLPQGENLPVTMPVQDAVESLKINLASFVKPPKMLQLLDTVEIKARGVVLVYIPFQKSGNELFQPAFNLRTTKALLEYAKYL
jgi:predicted Zn-ribbon and HTH transcriptional regulator/DNA-directed RNA polymerase subunit RPC12/RpoP